MFDIFTITKWQDSRDSSNRIAPGDLPTGRRFLLNTTCITDLWVRSGGSKFRFTDNPYDTREGQSYVETTKTVSEIIDMLDTTSIARAITLPIYTNNDPNRTIVNRTIGDNLLIYVHEYNPDPTHASWVTYIKDGFKRTEVLCSLSIDEIYDNLIFNWDNYWQQQIIIHAARVTVDGGINPNLTLLINTITTLRSIYGEMTYNEFIAKIPISLNPNIFGYKLGTGSGVTLGQACEKLYSINPLGDISQATVGNQPLLLIHSGENYYFCSRVAGNGCSTAGTSQVTTYNSATDTLRFTAKIFMNEQTAAAQDYVCTVGPAGNFRIQNQGANKILGFRGTANATSSSAYTPSATIPHWVRWTVDLTNVIYEWSANGMAWTNIGTVARPAVGAVSTTVQIGSTSALQTNAMNIYWGLFENVTTAKICTFDPNNYNRYFVEDSWVGADATWTISIDAGITGLKGLLIDESVVVGDGIAYKLINSSIVLSQPDTTYITLRRLGTGVVYGRGAASQLSNNATNTTLNNGTALDKANASILRQLLTIINNGASSSIQINNGTPTTGNAGTNNGTYLHLLANDAVYGNYVLTSYMVSNGT
jgi:hypothetical protein